MKVITRFPPSPTGALHLGGARTALYSYLFAKHHAATSSFESKIQTKNEASYALNNKSLRVWTGWDYTTMAKYAAKASTCQATWRQQKRSLRRVPPMSALAPQSALTPFENHKWTKGKTPVMTAIAATWVSQETL